MQPDLEWGGRRSRTVNWQDPASVGAAMASLPGREMMEAAAAGRLPLPPVIELIGARLSMVGDGESRFLYSPQESAFNHAGGVNGGVIGMLLDFAIGVAVQTQLPAGVGFTSIEMKVSFLGSVRGDTPEVEAHGEVLRVGRRVAFAQAHARTDEGKLVAHATSSLAVAPITGAGRT